MKKFMSIVFAALMLAVMPLKAGDERTLPSEFYAKLAHPGKKVNYVWTAPDFDKAKGFTFDGSLGWTASDRVSVFSDALKSGLKDISKPEGEYRLVVTVVHADAKWVLTGEFTLEGKLLDKDGKAVALFHTKELVGRVKNFESQVRGAADALVGAIDTEFRK